MGKFEGKELGPMLNNRMTEIKDRSFTPFVLP